MNYDRVPVSRMLEEFDAATPNGVFRNAKTVAAVEGIHRLAADPIARGDVLTQLTRPQARTSNNNEWAHLQADAMMLRIMQLVIDKAHAVSGGHPPSIFRDWVEVRADDPSRRHLVFKMYVIRRLKRGRSVLRRVLYHSVLYYLYHRADDHVEIRMTSPAAEMPQPSEAEGHSYFAYIKKRVVGPSARVNDTDDEDVPAAEDGTAVNIERGCMFKTAHKSLQFYLATLQDIDAAAVFAVAVLLRGFVANTGFDWHARTPPDHQGLFISSPGAYRLLLPRQSTRLTMDNQMFLQG